jgi:shikimate dehydrogenase
VLVLIVVAAGAIYWAQHQINPGGRRGPIVTVRIPAGSSTSKIASVLSADGIIHSSTLFAFYVRLHGDGPLLAGSYQLPKNSSYQSTIDALQAGPKIITATLVIPEGFTVAQIAQRVGALPGMGLSAAKFLAAADKGSVRSPYEPPGVNNLEGLLFPATYTISQGETEIDVLELLVQTFDQRADQLGLVAAAKALDETPYQLVTVASIVEREAKLAGDRGDVASVIYNRLKIGMPLGADSTETYYLRLADPTLVPTADELDQPGPYNTRLDKGLPPTPIANPGLPSLEAAASPPHTDYLYFVEINPDGQLGYASTESGFEGLQQQCRQPVLKAPTAHTRVAGVIGDPVRHSLSPVIHNAAFESLGLDWVYVAFPVPKGAGLRAVEAMRTLGLAGLSVTMPHKAEVVEGVDVLGPVAARLGVVNTLYWRATPTGDELVGESCDGAGFVDALRGDEGFDPAGQRCVVLGSGGAARSVALALGDAGASSVAVVARNSKAASECAGLAGPAGSTVAPERVAMAEAIGASALVVNATSVGMGAGDGLPFDLPLHAIGSQHCVVDLIYAPAVTHLLHECRSRGATAANGLGMLIYQAARQVEMWTGRSAPLAVMSAAALGSLIRRDETGSL